MSAAQAAERLARYGPNQLHPGTRTPELVKFLRQFKNFFALLLTAGALLAFMAEALDPHRGNLAIGIALLAVVLLNALFTYLQEHRSEQIMESFRRMLPNRVTVIREGREQRIEAWRLVPGDVMVLSEGDAVPADGRLIEEHRLKIDLSSVTGESEPQLRTLECTHPDILESRNMAFSGTLVQSGDGKALVFATGMATRIGHIVGLTRSVEEAETPLRRELKHFIRIISAIAIVLGVVFFVAGELMGRGELASLIFAIGIIVANVPEGLLPTVTLALSMATRRMAARKALVRNLESVETLGSTSVICTDKTGTLTQNRMSVSTVVVDGRAFAALDPQLRRQPGLETAWETMVLCNNAALSEDGYIGDPTEGALLAYAERLRPTKALHDMTRTLELPFDSATRRMITVCRSPEGRCRAYAKGAPEVILAMCMEMELNGRRVPLSAARRRRAEEAYRHLAGRGERIITLAYRDGGLDEAGAPGGFVFLGLVGLLDPPRPEVPEAIARCRSAGVRVIMITGDYGLTAEAIARQVGLIGERGRVVRGEQLAGLGDEALGQLLEEPELVFARTSPEHKLRIVRALQARGEVVTVTGDGVNDAPALKHADMGVSMGRSGTEVAREASHMVLLDDNFATIVAAIEEGRTIYANIRKFIAYILTSNVPEILPFIALVLLDVPLALTVVLILCIDLGTDILPALGLGAERPERDVMRHPPRPRGEHLLTPGLLLRSYGILGPLQAAGGFFAFFTVLFDGGWQWGQSLGSGEPLYRTAVTAFFAAVIFCQVANALATRTQHESLFRVGLLSNRLVLLGIAVELALLGAIAYLPPCNAFFGTAPLAAWQLALGLPFAVGIVAVEELRKLLLRRGGPRAARWLAW